jgi:hypothetical protein
MQAASETENDAQPDNKPQQNLALTLVVFSWCAWMVFQTVQLVRERHYLSQLKTNQESALQEANKARTHMEAIAKDTAKLAAEGNVNAQRILAELEKRGFKVSADAKPLVPAS